MLYSGSFSNEHLFLLPFIMNPDQREAVPIFLVILRTESPTFWPPEAVIADTFMKNQSRLVRNQNFFFAYNFLYFIYMDLDMDSWI